MHLTEYEISSYTDALRSSSVNNLPLNVIEHVEECLHCKHEIMELSSLLNEIEMADEEIPFLPKKKFKFLKRTGWPVSNYWLSAAAAFVLIFPLYIFFAHNAEKKQEITKVAAGKSESVEEKAPNKLSTADNYIGSKDNLPGYDLYTAVPEYESISGEYFRSENTAIISPSNSAKSSGKIKFNILFPDNGARIVSVLNNKNEEVYHQQINDKVFVREVNFKPGLYYWKVETDSDLLYIDKFIIK